MRSVVKAEILKIFLSKYSLLKFIFSKFYLIKNILHTQFYETWILQVSKPKEDKNKQHNNHLTSPEIYLLNTELDALLDTWQQ